MIINRLVWQLVQAGSTQLNSCRISHPHLLCCSCFRQDLGRHLTFLSLLSPKTMGNTPKSEAWSSCFLWFSTQNVTPHHDLCYFSHTLPQLCSGATFLLSAHLYLQVTGQISLCGLIFAETFLPTSIYCLQVPRAMWHPGYSNKFLGSGSCFRLWWAK